VKSAVIRAWFRSVIGTIVVLLCGCAAGPHGGPVFIPFTWLPDKTEYSISNAINRPRLSMNETAPAIARKTERWVYQNVAPEGVSFEEFQTRLAHSNETIGKKPCHLVLLRSEPPAPPYLRRFYFDVTGNPIQP
jgi:hypothetical protein